MHRPLREHVLALALALLSGTAASAGAETPAGTPIHNTALGSYTLDGMADTVRAPSNLVTIATRGGRTPAVLEFLRHAPNVPGSEWVRVSAADTMMSLRLVSTTTFQLGEVVYIRLTDRDQDLDPMLRETIGVDITVQPLADHELLLLRETEPSSGVFTGAIQSRMAVRSFPGDGRIDAAPESELDGRYVDLADPNDVAVDQAVFLGEAPRLHLEKSAVRARAAIGDLVEYSLRVSSASLAESPEAGRAAGVRIVDDLPAGFRYRPGTATRDAVTVSDPVISGDGRRLTFHVGDLEPGESAVVRYVVEVAVEARPGEAINTAEASSEDGLVSNAAQASIVVIDEFFRRGFIAGRVTVGTCGSLAPGQGPGVPGVGILLEDGTWTVTDPDGRYHFEGVAADMHVVAIDRRTLPAGLEPADCPDTHRFAGSRESQFVSLSEGTFWRADFQLVATSHGDSTGGGHASTAADLVTDPAFPAEPPALTDEFIARLEPGDEWLWPPAGFHPAIPGQTVIVKHAPDLVPELWANGNPVSKIHLNETRRNAAGTLAVSTWTGVDLIEGPNRFEVRGPGGEQIPATLTLTLHYAGPPVDAVLVPEQSRLLADGATPPIVAVRLVDRDGEPARERVVGPFAVDPPYVSLNEREARQENPLATLAMPRYQVGPDGVALIELEPTSRAGEIVLRFPFEGGTREIRAWLAPADRGWLLVGLADGTVGYRVAEEHAEPLEGDADADDFYEDGRLAFYARGRIKGEWLLTMAVDTKGRSRPIDELAREIDPDSYYTLYGDAAVQDYDAPTSRRVYVRIERREFMALFGDMDTGLTRTELNRYSRRISGFRTDYRGRHAGWTAFAANSESGFVRREIRGNGTSGPYDLESTDMVINSEEVVVETRDRFRSEIILRTRTLHRHVDYDIDYPAGTLFFREPIFSQDDDFNPNWLVVTFETRAGQSTRWQAGGRASLQFGGDRVEAGATGVYDEDGIEPGRLAGGDLQWRVDSRTTVRGEAAWSEDGEGREGSGWLAELERRGGAVDGTAWYRRQEPGFGLSQQNRGEEGIEKFGADAAWHLTRFDRVRASAFRQLNLVSGARRDVGEADIAHDTGRFDLRGGVRRAVDEIPGRSDAVSNQVTAGADARDLAGHLGLRAEHHQSIGGDNNNADYPTRTILGADWRVWRGLSVVASQEFTNGPAADTRSTRIGLETRPWGGGEILGSLGRQTVENGTRVFANLGMHQAWRISERWFFDAGFDRSLTLGDRDTVRVNPGVPPASAGTADLLAATLGAARHGDGWQWNGRVEYVDTGSETRWTIVPSLLIQPRRAVGLALGSRVILTRGAIDRTRSDVRASLALRPDQSPWMVLDRLDWVIFDDSGPGREVRDWRLIDNLHVNRRFGSRWQGALQYGAKYIEQTFGNGIQTGFTDLWGLEVRHDIRTRFDAGISGGLRQSWKGGQRDWFAGASAGCVVARGMWLQAGYNVAGFSDEDFADAAATSHGPWLRLSARFDGDALGMLGFGTRSELTGEGGEQ